MRFYKAGFTLAEALLVLGIIGIVTAVVMPMLVNNTQRNQAGATLGRVVSQFELGCEHYIQNKNLDNDDISYSTVMSGVGKISKEELAKYVGAEKPSGATEYYFKKFNASYKISNLASSDPAYTIRVDVNGDKKPDKYGVDMFEFDLMDNCKMRPAGYDGYDSCPGSTDATRKTCTARVVADGFKITY